MTAAVTAMYVPALCMLGSATAVVLFCPDSSR